MKTLQEIRDEEADAYGDIAIDNGETISEDVWCSVYTVEAAYVAGFDSATKHLSAEIERTEAQNQRLRVDSKLNALLECRDLLATAEETIKARDAEIEHLKQQSEAREDYWTGDNATQMDSIAKLREFVAARDAKILRLREALEFVYIHLESMDSYSLVSGARHIVKSALGKEDKND